MAKAEQLKALVSSHVEGDDSRFFAVVMQVAAQAARSGHGNLAQELRKLVDDAKAKSSAIELDRGPRAVPLARPRGELAGLLSVSYPKTRLCEMALTEQLQGQLERVVIEQRQRERLRAHGFAPQRKLLFIGPPGTGKTMTASALAAELGLPLFTIQLDGLITKFMGETAVKLRLVFEAIESTRGVYLFDEFDALGGRRSASNDVGEIRRVLNSFLQFLEQDDSDSLVIGSTNHVDLLDQALFRRFDAVLAYELPTPEVSSRVMQDRLASLDTSDVNWDVAVSATRGLSHAEIVRACVQAAKDALLIGTMAISAQSLVTVLDERRAMLP